MDFAGAIKGEAVEVYPGLETGLPIPVHTEIVLEGELPLDVTCQKGLLGSFPAITHPRRGHRR